MLDLVQSSKFKKDLKKALKQGKDFRKLEKVINLLCSTQPLPRKNCDHNLAGTWQSYRECHISPDWLLIYRIDKKNNALLLARTGSHADLFT